MSIRDASASWTPESFTAFAMRSQLPSLWLLACAIVDRAARTGTPLDAGARGLDAGCGPAILSRMVALRSGAAIEVAAQTPEFEIIADRLRLPDAPAQIVVHPASSLVQLRERFKVAWSYAFMHEAEDPLLFARRVGDAVTPGGLVLIFDTLRDAAAAVEVALDHARLPGEAAMAVRRTFAASLSLDEAQSVLAAALPGACTSILTFDDRLLLEAELDCPQSFASEEPLEIDAPTLFMSEWRRPFD